MEKSIDSIGLDQSRGYFLTSIDNIGSFFSSIGAGIKEFVKSILFFIYGAIILIILGCITYVTVILFKKFYKNKIRTSSQRQRSEADILQIITDEHRNENRNNQIELRNILTPPASPRPSPSMLRPPNFLCHNE